MTCRRPSSGLTTWQPDGTGPPSSAAASLLSTGLPLAPLHNARQGGAAKLWGTTAHVWCKKRMTRESKQAIYYGSCAASGWVPGLLGKSAS